MKYGYRVKYNGVLYAPGEDVPNDVEEEKVVADEVATPPEEKPGRPSRKK